jgi:heat shock protein HslJ
MAFYPDSYLEGDAGCNSFGSDYTFDGGQFHIVQLHRTNFDCDLPAEVKQQETAFFAALESSSGIQATENQLELSDASGEPLLAFSRKLPPPVDPILLDTEWILVSMGGESPLEGSRITLNFDQEGAGGYAGCNSYGGEYETADGGALSLPEIWQTEMDCERSEVMEQESAYVQVLRTAAAYRATEDRLELTDASGADILIYARQEEMDLEPGDLLGSSWRLASLDGVSTLEGEVFTLAFHNEQRVSGQAGCRHYVATYSARGDSMQFTYMAMMGAVCLEQETLMSQEGEYTTVLGWTSRYRLDGDRLELQSERGEVLTFERLAEEPGTSLAESQWALLAFVEEKKADGMPESIVLVQELLAGTGVTAQFGPDTVTGSAGCNTYRASCALDAAAISFGPAASTRMACPEPAGRMEQEQRYLDLLGQVTSYQRFHDQLWLEAGDGQALVFKPLGGEDGLDDGPNTPQPEARDCSGPDAFPTEEAEIMWPVLREIRPGSAAAGDEIEVLAAGGHLFWDNECGQFWLESARDYQVFWDGEPWGSITCYANTCAVTATIPAGSAAGLHTLSVEGGSSLEVEVSE